MYVCIYIYIYIERERETYIYVCMHICMFICIYVCMYIHIYIYIYICSRILVYSVRYVICVIECSTIRPFVQIELVRTDRRYKRNFSNNILTQRILAGKRSAWEVLCHTSYYHYYYVVIIIVILLRIITMIIILRGSWQGKGLCGTLPQRDVIE